MNNPYSRKDEANLPKFKSHKEARAFFKEKHDDDFQLVDSDLIDGREIYFYNLYIDREAYFNGMRTLQENGYVEGSILMNSHQRIEIWEDGEVHMIH